jgi:transposase
MGSEAVEIITGHERRRRWSVADKLRILAECDEPGARVAEVAARHGVYRSLVFQWRRQAREALLVAEPTPEFVPVRLADAAASTVRPEAASPEATPAPQRPQPRAGLVEIELPDGVRVRVGDEVGLATLRRVLAALRG